jgi:hypothetical protein
LIRAYCASTYQSQRKSRRSSKRSRSKKAKANEDLSKQSCLRVDFASRSFGESLPSIARRAFLWLERSAAGGLPHLSIERSKSGKPNGSIYISHRAMTKGGGPSGAIVTEPPLGRTDAPAGGASGIAASVAGGLPGSTTTRVPTFTRV